MHILAILTKLKMNYNCKNMKKSTKIILKLSVFARNSLMPVNLFLASILKLNKKSLHTENCFNNSIGKVWLC